MSDLPRLASRQDMLDGGFDPKGIDVPEGLDGRDHPTFWFARWRGAPDFLFVAKFSTMQVRRVALASTWLMTCCERALAMESWLVALSNAKGEGLSGREPQSSPKHGPPTMGDWVVGPLWQGELLIEW